jgi:hypothetical protein
MQIVEGLTVIGLTVRSPCYKCPIHQLGLPKAKSEFCVLCKSRFQYDELIKSGTYSYPFLKPEQMKLLESKQ